MHKLLSLIHRVLLRLKPYKKLIISLGLDSRWYKQYYRTLHFDTTNRISEGEVDGYKDESNDERIVQLVNLIFQNVSNPRSILDLGCGTGRYLKQMRTVYPDAHFEGVDISSEIVETFTRHMVPGIPVHVLDIETDETFHVQNREKFDLVCMIGIIQILSLGKIHRILDKVNRLMKDGGYLYVQFNTETKEKKSSVGYKRYAIDELGKLLEDHGFEIINGSRTDILKDYAYIIARKLHVN
ncbi:MAG: class I SAM-dependent methyltransferase [Candidatus Omnitrophota bacterium]